MSLIRKLTTAEIMVLAFSDDCLFVFFWSSSFCFLLSWKSLNWKVLQLPLHIVSFFSWEFGIVSILLIIEINSALRHELFNAFFASFMEHFYVVILRTLECLSDFRLEGLFSGSFELNFNGVFSFDFS